MTKKHAQNNIQLNNKQPIETIQLKENISINSEGTNVPNFIMVIPAGEVVGRDGRWWVNKNPDAIVARFNEDAVDLVIDYEHGSELWGDGSPVAASGWVKNLQNIDGAIWANVEWTEKAAQMIADKEYRYISPAFWVETPNIVGALTSVALVQKPNLGDLPALNNKNDETDLNNMEGEAMNKEERAKLCEKLGLQPEASLNSILEAIDKQEKALNKAKTPSLEQFVPRADFDAKVSELNTIKQTQANEVAEQRKVEINSLIEGFVDEGKIPPASKQHYIDICSTDEGLASVKNLVKDMPSINLNKGGGAGGNLPKGDHKTLNAMEKEIAEGLNLTDEEYLAAK